MQSDLDYVLSLEQDPANLPFITPWERTQHEAAIRFPDFRHFIIEAGAGLDAAGFVILIGCRSQNQSLELKRMVVQEKGLGFGRAALRVVKKIVFDDLGAHRFWLDVKERNARAQGLYQRRLCAGGPPARRRARGRRARLADRHVHAGARVCRAPRAGPGDVCMKRCCCGALCLPLLGLLPLAARSRHLGLCGQQGRGPLCLRAAGRSLRAFLPRRRAV
jgi:RimJ/RimL family protein N-acetyltransferase